MANFTDNVQALSTFNPYISQAPIIEEMSIVGREKQAKYDAGIEKIQGQIDQVAGIDLVKDVHKEYLQKSLNQLGRNLKFVAAGDFSNYQLVNSVGGMVNSIGKDKNIQDAVANTAKYRKENANAEALQKAGKFSVNREYDLARANQAWLNDPNMKAQYTGQAKEHIDVSKKVLDVIGKLHPNASLVDIPNVINKDGTIDTAHIAAVMQRQGIKEVSESKIRTAVNAVLDENDFDELASQGRYAYRGVEGQGLQNMVNQVYSSTVVDYRSKLEDLKKQLLITSDGQQQLELNDGIKYYETMLGDGITPGTLESRYRESLDALYKNPDAVRSAIYTKNYLDQVANGFQWREVSTELLDNPIQKDMWKRLDHELNWSKEIFDRKYKLANLGLEGEKLKILQAKAAAEAEAAGGSTPYFHRSGDETLDNMNSLQNYYKYQDKLVTENKDITADLAKKYSSYEQRVSPDDVVKKITLYKNNPAGNTPKNYDEKKAYDQYIRNESVLATSTAHHDRLEAQVRAELNLPIIPLNQQLKSHANLNVHLANGQTITFSPQEVYKYLEKEKQNITGGPASRIELSVDDEQLTPREVELKKFLHNRYEGTSSVGAPSSGNSAVDAHLDNIAHVVRGNQVGKAQVASIMAERMADITGDFGTDQAAIKVPKVEDKKAFISELTNIIMADQASVTGGLGYKTESALPLLASDNVQFDFVRRGSDYYVEVSDLKDDSKREMIPIPEEFVRKSPALGEKFLNQNVDISDIMLRNYGTTNIFKDYDHAYYSTGYFGSTIPSRTVTLPIAADFVSTSVGLSPVFWLKIPGQAKALKLELSYPVEKDYFENDYLPGLTNERIIAIFKTEYPDIEELLGLRPDQAGPPEAPKFTPPPNTALPPNTTIHR